MQLVTWYPPRTCRWQADLQQMKRSILRRKAALGKQERAGAGRSGQEQESKSSYGGAHMTLRGDPVVNFHYPISPLCQASSTLRPGENWGSIRPTANRRIHSSDQTRPDFRKSMVMAHGCCQRCAARASCLPMHATRLRQSVACAGGCLTKTVESGRKELNACPWMEGARAKFCAARSQHVLVSRTYK